VQLADIYTPRDFRARPFRLTEPFLAAHLHDESLASDGNGRQAEKARVVDRQYEKDSKSSIFFKVLD
jgi:hypothetical protein